MFFLSSFFIHSRGICLHNDAAKAWTTCNNKNQQSQITVVTSARLARSRCCCCWKADCFSFVISSFFFFSYLHGSFTSSIEGFILDPVKVGRDAGVDAWLAGVGTADAPRNHTDGGPTARVHFEHQRSTRIPLKMTEKLNNKLGPKPRPANLKSSLSRNRSFPTPFKHF